MFYYKLVCAAGLLVNLGACAWSIANKTDARINIIARYQGKTSFSCRPDNFWLEPRQVKTIDAGWCALSSLTSGNGAFAYTGTPSGRRFMVVQDGSGYWIKKHD